MYLIWLLVLNCLVTVSFAGRQLLANLIIQTKFSFEHSYCYRTKYVHHQNYYLMALAVYLPDHFRLIQIALQVILLGDIQPRFCLQGVFHVSMIQSV
jgi:hypothetical protein